MKLIKKTYKDIYPAHCLDEDGFIAPDGFGIGLAQSWSTKETISFNGVDVPVYEVDLFYHHSIYHVRLWSRGELKDEKRFSWKDEAFAFVGTVVSLLYTVS